MTLNPKTGSLLFEKAKSHRKRKKLRPSTRQTWKGILLD